MSMTLSGYLSKTRFFLRDALSTAFSDADLTDLINQARADLIMDTFCCRSLVQIPTVANQEAYTFATVLTAVQATGATAVAVLQINSMGVFWSSNLVPVMDNLPWDEFSAIYRSFRSYTFIPFCWAMYDLQTFYVAPLPNSIYTLEVDCTYLPTYLLSDRQMKLLFRLGSPILHLFPGWRPVTPSITRTLIVRANRFSRNMPLS